MSTLESKIDQLKKLRNELTQRIDAIETDIHHKTEPVEKDFAEQVTQRENDEVLAALDGEAQHTVSLIDTALHRIKNGNYGICIKCGERIPDARLDAIPYTTTCVKCAD